MKQKYHKKSGRAVGDTTRDAIVVTRARKPLPGQMELPLEKGIQLGPFITGPDGKIGSSESTQNIKTEGGTQ